MARWKIAGINFDHFHMGDNLRFAFEHPDCEIVAICDEQPGRLDDAASNFKLRADQRFTNYRACLESCQPDLVILCPATAQHAEWTERIAPFNVHLLMEKPFAASLAEADRMITAMAGRDRELAIHWPIIWQASHSTAKRLVDQGAIGDVIEVHHYGGNRGPLWHAADKIERTAEEVAREKPHSWFYHRAHGGGSLLDYLGYGTTLATWFMNGKAPIEVTGVVDEPIGLEVDEHAIVVARYAHGLSKFETRWGTYTDPWTHQPQPRCGFVLVGTEGTLSSYDYAETLHIQDRKTPAGRDIPAEPPPMSSSNPIAYMIDRIEQGLPIEGPMSLAMSRIGQQIVDTAMQSAREKRTLPLIR